MDSKYKAWQLAQILYWHMKINNMTNGLTEEGIKISEPFERIGSDKRIHDKYFKMMLKWLSAND